MALCVPARLEEAEKWALANCDSKDTSLQSDLGLSLHCKLHLHIMSDECAHTQTHIHTSECAVAQTERNLRPGVCGNSVILQQRLRWLVGLFYLDVLGE